MENGVRVVLVKHGEGWGLPSVSAGCIQAEAYLRMAGIPFAEDVLSTPGTSPTGALPAVETPHGAGGFCPPGCSDLEAAAAVIVHLQKHVLDVDRTLSARERSDCAAFACLVETKLNAAVLYATWCEWQSMRHIREAFGDTLPWPLNYVIPLSKSWAMKRRFQELSPEQVYEDGCKAITAISNRIAASDGHYLLGEKPCSLDAKLFGLLAFVAASPVVAPVLKEHIKGCRALMAFVEHVSSEFFSSPAPALSDPDMSAAWSAAAKGVPRPKPHEDSPEEKKQKRRSWYWLGGAAALMVGYVVLGGQYFDIGIREGDEEDDVDE